MTQPQFRLNHRQAGKKIENQLILINEDCTEEIVDTSKGKARHQVVVKKYSNEGMIKFWKGSVESSKKLPWEKEEVEKRVKKCMKHLECWQKKKDQGLVEYIGYTWSYKAGQKVELNEGDYRFKTVAIITL